MVLRGPEIVTMKFREKFQRLMEDRNQAAVARRAGITRMAVAGYLAGAYAPRTKTAVRLARALNVEISWLIDDSATWPPVWTNYPVTKHERAASAA
jgi:transcriptional regulator with XRE-family HTH domain